MSKHIVLTVSLLISDRPDTVRKCLDSVKPLLEQVPSELILVDTGCGETVRSIVEEHTDKIVSFRWCRDFSKARNAGLERAKGEWFLYLDDDEWFEDVTDIVRFFRSGEYKAYGVGLYTQRNYLTWDGSEYAELLVSRMIRLEPDIRFIYKIHECFNRAPGAVKKLDAYVHHYGYLYRSREEREAHAMRNISLLLEELEEHPRNMKHVLQLVQEYNSIDDREKSLQLSLDSIRMAEQGPVEGEYCLASLYANEINCYIELGRYEDAISRGERHLRSSRPDKLAKALMAGRLTAAYIEAGNYAECLERAKYYWDIYQEYRRNSEAFMEYDTPVTSTCFHPQRLALVLGNGIRAAIHFGDDGLVWQWFQGIGWEGNKAYVDGKVIREILERMEAVGEKRQEPAAGAGSEPAAEGKAQEYYHYRRMCDTLLGHGEWKDYVLQVILENCGRGETLKERVRTAAAYKDVASDHWFLKLIRLATAAFAPEGTYVPEDALRLGMENEAGGKDGQGKGQMMPKEGQAASWHYAAEEAERLAGEIWNVMEESLPQMEAYDLPEVLRLLGGDNKRVIEGIPFRRWEKGAAGYLGRYGWEGSRWWTERLEEILGPEHIRLLLWKAVRGACLACGEEAAMEREAPEGSGGAAGSSEATGMPGRADAPEDSSGSVEGASATAAESRMDGIFRGLKEFASYRTALCERIYRAEIIRERPDILPPEDRGAYAVRTLLEQAEEGRYAEALGSVRELKDLLPGMASVLKQCVRWLEDQINRREEERRQESAKAAMELQALGRQIKKQIYAMERAGQYQAALGIVEQLQVMLPGDEELVRLRDEILKKC